MVRSMDRSLPWYTAMMAALGFDKGRDHVWGNGAVALDLQEAAPGTPDYERYAPGLNHLGFTAADRAALAAGDSLMLRTGSLSAIGTGILATFQESKRQ